MKDPGLVEMLVHDDGVLVPELDVVYRGRRAHDPGNLGRDHVLFHQLLDATKVPQIPGIGYWDGGDRTWERPDARELHIRAINDDHGRIMVLMTHNTDFGDAYERETENPQYFMKFSVPGYAFGINAYVYAMTH